MWHAIILSFCWLALFVHDHEMAGILEVPFMLNKRRYRKSIFREVSEEAPQASRGICRHRTLPSSLISWNLKVGIKLPSMPSCAFAQQQQQDL